MPSLATEVSSGLGLSGAFVKELADRASHAYKTYTIAKRSGGRRIIHHPSKQLKTVQRWLLKRILRAWKVHSSAYAYVEGKSAGDNARRHAGAKFLLRLDFKDFFHSIKSSDVCKLAALHRPDWSQTDLDMFTSLVTFNGALTIGAPTSPILSNAACHDMDSALSSLDDRVLYTRYADDLFFSTSTPNILQDIEERVVQCVSHLSLPQSLKINAKKTAHMSARGRMMVTGVILGSDGSPGPGRSLIRRIRSLIHKWSSQSDKERRQAAGLLAHAASLDKDLINRLIMKYGPELIGRVRQGSP